MILNDNSPMPFGKYKGQKLIDVPASYFLWLYDNNYSYGNIKDYIIDNLDVLHKEINEKKI